LARLFASAALLAQSNTGELRIQVTDHAGLPVPCTLEIVSQANQVQQRRPSFSLDASEGPIVRAKERQTVWLQAEAQNLTDRLNVLDFAGLFSGIALAARRSVALRLPAEW